MSEPVTDAAHAVAIARRYAESATTYLYWKDVIDVKQNAETHNWEVTYEAAAGAISPYTKYFVEINSQDSTIITAKKLE